MNVKADSNNDNEIGAPLQGRLSKVLVKTGQEVKKNEALFIIEAMKMETSVTAVCNSKIKKILLKEGSMVNTDDLIITLDN